jgi:hypothetical protein
MKKRLTTTKISQLIILTTFSTSGLANDCQTATLTSNNNLIVPCVAVGEKYHRLTLNFLPLGEIGSQMYWKSGDFQEIQCQPDPNTCATLQNQFYLKMPLKINETKYIIHLKKYPSLFTNIAYWQYRYHYQAKNFNLKSKALTNQAAYIPPQCYTKTKDAQGKVHNPCFTCHQQARIPNYNNDPDLQSSYTFAEYALTNRWHNLFHDRSQAVAAISDAEILSYIRQNNYQDPQGRLILREKLQALPADWDFDNNGRWDGYLPDCYFNFDEQGFDRDLTGNYTGWRAFAYYPFPGTFWPTNGSTDDVIIRLPAVFQQDSAGQFDPEVYQLNLAIVEALIKRQTISIPPVDEQKYQVDLDKNGQLTTAEKIVYDWAPLEGKFMNYVGKAKLALAAGEQYLAAGLFPLGTEFLHTVRYIDFDQEGKIKLAARIKELRYARKASWRNYGQLQDAALNEIKENHDFPDRLRQIIGNLEYGVSNDQGWILQGFIEDAQGELRPQSYEEHLFCVSCHSTIGAITDSTFAFARKLPPKDSPQQGWYHWNQHNLNDLPEPQRRDGQYEYTFYLQHNGAGDEFRANEEIIQRFFDDTGALKTEQIQALHNDISRLLWPSTQRALQLNKAYQLIVQQQSFIAGRDATITPPQNVHRQLLDDESTGITEILSGP